MRIFRWLSAVLHHPGNMSSRKVRVKKLTVKTLLPVLREDQIDASEYESLLTESQIATGVDQTEENVSPFHHHIHATATSDITCFVTWTLLDRSPISFMAYTEQCIPTYAGLIQPHMHSSALFFVTLFDLSFLLLFFPFLSFFFCFFPDSFLSGCIGSGFSLSLQPSYPSLFIFSSGPCNYTDLFASSFLCLCRNTTFNRF